MMKLVTFSVLLFVGNILAQIDWDVLPSLPDEPTKEPEYGFPMPLMWLTTNHSIAVDYDNITKSFNHPDVADRKIVAVSIIGALRKGKSLFMNYCLRYMYANYKSVNFQTNPLDKKTNWIGASDTPLSGFSFRGGADRDTTGVIMWSDIFLHETKVGNKTEKIAIVLFDTQGLFDDKTSPGDNTRICALGTLISSVQIFNTNDVLQANQLEYLQLATDYAQLHANISSVKAAKPFQKLIFLMRDWVHITDYTYGKKGGDRYITDYLASTNNLHLELKNVREYMKNSFDEITGFLLPHPGPEVTKKSYDGRSSLMNSDFREQLVDSIEMLLNPENLLKKRILDYEVSGSDYGGFLLTYFKTFQSRDTPDVQSVYEATVETQLGNFVRLAMKKYVAALNNHIDYNRTDFEEYLEKVHLKAAEMTLLGFKSVRKMGTEKDEKAFTKRLQQEMKEFSLVWKKTHIKTWHEIQRRKQESEDRIKAEQLESERKIAEQKKKQEAEALKMEQDYIAKMNEVEAQTNLTFWQKDEKLRQLQEDRDNQEQKFNETIASKIQQLEQEAELSRVEAELKINKTIEGLKNDGSSKTSLVFKAIESSRQLFMDMFKMQADQQNADRKNLHDRWKREDELKVQEMEKLKAMQDAASMQRKMEIEREDRIRQEDKLADQKRYEAELALRKLEAQSLKEERDENRKQFQTLMLEMNKPPVKNKAVQIPSQSVVLTFIVAGVIVMTSFVKKQW